LVTEDLDHDLDVLDRIALLTEAKRMRRAIRKHRDSIGHALCWHHPDMWDLLPDKLSVEITVPDWPQFMRGCIRYRSSLDEQLPDAKRTTREFEGRGK
jgi:hypothetical protein